MSNDTADMPILYCNNLSTSCRSCMMLIDILGINVERCYVNMNDDGTLDVKDMRKFSIFTIPTLLHNDFILTDSHAILIYLSDNFGGEYSEQLFPTAFCDHFHVLNSLFFEGSVLLKRYCRLLLDIVTNTYVNMDFAYHEHKIHQSYEILETYLTKSTYLAGNQITIADICMVTTVASLDLVFRIDQCVEKWPNLCKWFELMRLLPAYKVNIEGIEKLRSVIAEKGKHILPLRNKRVSQSFRTVNKPVPLAVNFTASTAGKAETQSTQQRPDRSNITLEQAKPLYSQQSKIPTLDVGTTRYKSIRFNCTETADKSSNTVQMNSAENQEDTVFENTAKSGEQQIDMPQQAIDRSTQTNESVMLAETLLENENELVQKKARVPNISSQKSETKPRLGVTAHTKPKRSYVCITEKRQIKSDENQYFEQTTTTCTEYELDKSGQVLTDEREGREPAGHDNNIKPNQRNQPEILKSSETFLIFKAESRGTSKDRICRIPQMNRSKNCRKLDKLSARAVESSDTFIIMTDYKDHQEDGMIYTKRPVSIVKSSDTFIFENDSEHDVNEADNVHVMSTMKQKIDTVNRPSRRNMERFSTNMSKLPQMMRKEQAKAAKPVETLKAKAKQNAKETMPNGKAEEEKGAAVLEVKMQLNDNNTKSNGKPEQENGATTGWRNYNAQRSRAPSKIPIRKEKGAVVLEAKMKQNDNETTLNGKAEQEKGATTGWNKSNDQHSRSPSKIPIRKW